MKLNSETKVVEDIDVQLDRTMVDKFTGYVRSRNLVSRLALQFVIATSIYGVITAVLPPQYTLWFWQTVVTVVFMTAVGLFAWHETIGISSSMKSIYKLLHRVTGDRRFLTLIGGEDVK